VATKLFLRSSQANGIGATYFDMLTTAGSGSATAVVNSAASGTEIQWTDTAGGSVVQFVSGRAPSGGFTLTSTDISIWALESNGQANCGGRFRVFKRAANVTDTAFAENDRILLKLYITNVGTMGSGRTCTLTYNAADASTGDSFFNIAETVAFKTESTTHTSTGALTGQIGSVAGSAAHIAVHGATGALVGQIGSVSGSASSATTRPSSGDLVGPGSVVAGSAARTRVHTTSGVLAGQGAVVAGSAERTGTTVSHAASGDLIGPGSLLAGSAARQRIHAATGALVGELGGVSGEARLSAPGKRFDRRYPTGNRRNYMWRR
jgi:hypothetical protein